MKPKVLLLHPLYGMETKQRIFQPGVELPISLAYLASYLDQAGFESEIIDLRIESRPQSALSDRLAASRPLAVGITAASAAIDNAAALAGIIKAEYPQIFTVLGGWHASALPEETLRHFPHFDYLVHGEGERAFTDLLTCLAGGGSLEEVKGVAWRAGEEIQVNPRPQLIPNLDDLPFPARDKVPIERYRPRPGTRNYRSLPTTGLVVGRGCPYRCFFCYKGVWGSGVRLRSRTNVLQEVEHCLDRYGIRDFRFYDDAITQPKWDLETFCEDLIRRDLHISWNCWSRVNDVTESKLRLMKAAGCYHIKFGIEFGTEKALNLARKGASLDQAREAVALAKTVGLECKGSFIFGIPGETEADCRETIRFALEISPHFATFYGFDPVVGSPFYEQIKKGKIIPQRDMLPTATTARLVDEAYKKFYFRPTFFGQRLEQFIRHPQEETRMLWDGAVMTARHWFAKRADEMNNFSKPDTAEPTYLPHKSVIPAIFWEKMERLLEITVASIMLVITSPLIALIWLAIKFDSPGPAIFKQLRVGKNYRNGHPPSDYQRCRRKQDLGGKPFTFYKFRTMYVDARERFPELYRYQYSPEEIQQLQFKMVNDPRLTRLGRHLRKTTLDELPNFFNLFNGDISLVGPRPDIPEMVRYYNSKQMKKFAVKPGISGLSQVNGRGILTFQETLDLDVAYVENRSLWMDAKIILKTLWVSIHRVGAF